jgi:hypothetical protein
MYEDSALSIQEALYDAGYQDGLENYQPTGLSSRNQYYARGYDDGFMLRYGLTWTHHLTREES